MNPSFLSSLTEYSRFVAELLNRAPVERSTVAVWSESPYTGIAEGEVFFSNGLRLRMRKEINFDAHLIVSYGYRWHPDIPSAYIILDRGSDAEDFTRISHEHFGIIPS